MEKEICLLNDSFPPIIDGVANVVTNYARVLNNNSCAVSVVTPENPDAEDSVFPYPVVRYPALDLRKYLGYTAGNPFSVPALKGLAKRDIGLLHSHCPVMSNILARQLRAALNVPLVMTYHTRFDIEVADRVRIEPVQDGAIRALVESVSACDELWAVSDGAGRSLQRLGYEGDYVVMPNGVDIPVGRASDAEIAEIRAQYNLPEEVPLFLFVGRMMWYKGIRIILEALAALQSNNLDFRMVFVGGGGVFDEIRACCTSLKLDGKCFFTGAVRDRKALTAWYSAADLMLFPSTFDTNGLVVREAAACSLGTVLVRNSCAAEGVSDGHNGLLIDENAASLAVTLTLIMNNRDRMHGIGENACRELYLSWDAAIRLAVDRYEVVIENYRSGRYPRHINLTEGLLKMNGELLDDIIRLENRRKALEAAIELELEKFR